MAVFVGIIIVFPTQLASTYRAHTLTFHPQNSTVFVYKRLLFSYKSRSICSLSSPKRTRPNNMGTPDIKSRMDTDMKSQPTTAGAAADAHIDLNHYRKLVRSYIDLVWVPDKLSKTSIINILAHWSWWPPIAPLQNRSLLGGEGRYAQQRRSDGRLLAGPMHVHAARVPPRRARHSLARPGAHQSALSVSGRRISVRGQGLPTGHRTAERYREHSWCDRRQCHRLSAATASAAAADDSRELERTASRHLAAQGQSTGINGQPGAGHGRVRTGAAALRVLHRGAGRPCAARNADAVGRTRADRQSADGDAVHGRRGKGAAAALLQQDEEVLRDQLSGECVHRILPSITSSSNVRFLAPSSTTIPSRLPCTSTTSS